MYNNLIFGALLLFVGASSCNQKKKQSHRFRVELGFEIPRVARASIVDSCWLFGSRGVAAP